MRWPVVICVVICQRLGIFTGAAAAKAPVYAAKDVATTLRITVGRSSAAWLDPNVSLRLKG
jgi:hypothetical protein